MYRLKKSASVATTELKRKSDCLMAFFNPKIKTARLSAEIKTTRNYAAVAEAAFMRIFYQVYALMI